MEDAMMSDDSQKWMMDQICDIGKDTDTILKKMGGNKMGDHFDMGMLTGLLQGRGIDTGELVALLNNKQGGWEDQGGIWLILLLLIILGGGNFGGLGGRNGSIAGVDTNAVLNAISTQGIRQEQAIGSIANTLGCSFGQVQSALASVDKQIAVNQGSIVNAIQSCCCNLGNKIDQCCCQTNLGIERMGNNLANQLNVQSQLLQKSFCDQNAFLADQFCKIQLREQENTIAELRNRVLEQSQDAQTKIILNAIENQKMVYDGKIDGTLFSGTGTVS